MSTKTRKFRLRDVDGTIPGVCIMTVVRVGPDVAEDKIVVGVDRFTEEPDRPNPRLFAEGLWESIKDDWPDCRVSYSVNERAQYLSWDQRMTSMGFDSKPPRDYWEEYA